MCVHKFWQLPKEHILVCHHTCMLQNTQNKSNNKQHLVGTRKFKSFLMCAVYQYTSVRWTWRAGSRIRILCDPANLVSTHWFWCRQVTTTICWRKACTSQIVLLNCKLCFPKKRISQNKSNTVTGAPTFSLTVLAEQLQDVYLNCLYDLHLISLHHYLSALLLY